MATIKGMVADFRDAPFPEVSVLLMGGGITPLVSITSSDGHFSFANLGVGKYKLSAIYRTSVTEQEIDILNPADEIISDLKLQSLVFKPTTWEYVVWNRFVLLKYGQYAFLAAIGWFFFDKLVADRLPLLSLDSLNDIEVARGAITYLITVTTLSMAALLMLAAIMTGGKDLDKRFTLGKEILTTLVGILGTIVGFYFGTSTKVAAEAKAAKATLDTLFVSQFEKKIIVKGKVSGGVAPFIYSISTEPQDLVSKLSNVTSEDGNINDTLYILDEKNFKPSQKFSVKGRDKDGRVFNKTQSLAK